MFKYDDAGRPRQWTPNDDINSVYDRARQRAEATLGMYKRAALDPAALVRQQPGPERTPMPA